MSVAGTLQSPCSHSRCLPLWHPLTRTRLFLCLSLCSPAAFLCPVSANTYGIDFLSFTIRDASPTSTLSDPVIFTVSKDPSHPTPALPPDFDPDQLRHIAYHFPLQFLRLRSVSTALRFSVGPQEVRNFRMIERHYTVDRRQGGRGGGEEVQYALLKSYDFNFHFCIPNSTNEWESVYDMPRLSSGQIDSIARQGTVSDSFYFVGDQLIMHNKATYSYSDEEHKHN